ncbi:hypothetical protein RHSIM_Rhsim13G0135200 [Rhododendron simsii]|uniref:SWIM-type domain-containing protein n=1 Tax=Rhododendron simsii TaxID=118357 RepID=A0A834FZ99_RHOSS|nr:hypothetical protein RHSIM_Rhsim13G0135200 [Rhododendron simsii]
MTIYELESGGLENVGCSQQDLYNYKRDKEMMVDGHDANLMLEYFQSEKAKNDGFTFTIEKDDEDRMTHCFWADATARKSYQYFGDVVVFDTTYSTNRYSMIFAPILGVNHHRQTTLFGCAFLCDETAETFEWLFKEWLKAMPAGPPKMIITDQDLAMTKAIASALPNTLHRALARIRHNELDKDHKDVNERPNLKSMYPMEETMSELYTIDIFYMFQDELFQNTAYKLMAKNEDEHRVVYAVHRIKGSGSRVREIVVDKSSNHVSCSCKMFECAGIPCRHILAYFSRMQIEDLPNEYILRRWTKSTKALRVRDDLGPGMKEICDKSLLEWRNRLFKLASSLIDEAMITEDGTEFVEEHLSLGHKKLCDMNKVSQDGERSAIQVPIIRDHGLKEPLQVRAKGCGKRLKGGKEKVAKKVRRCHGCGLTGQSHDKRNCPKLLSTSSQNARLDDEDDDIDYADDSAADCKCSATAAFC